MRFRRLHLALGILLLAALPLAAQAQKNADPFNEWETISPEGEEFTVSMPKNPTTESTTFPYHKMELSARLYLAKSNAGPVLAIASLSGIKSNPPATCTRCAGNTSTAIRRRSGGPSRWAGRITPSSA